MKRSRFSEEQIIGILKEHEAGVSVDDLCRKHAIAALPDLALLVVSISSSGLLNAGALRTQGRPRLLLRRVGG
jgi:Transposase